MQVDVDGNRTATGQVLAAAGRFYGGRLRSTDGAVATVVWYDAEAGGTDKVIGSARTDAAGTSVWGGPEADHQVRVHRGIRIVVTGAPSVDTYYTQG